MLGQEHSLTSADLQYIDPVIAKSFLQLEDILRQKHRILADKSHVSRKYTAGSVANLVDFSAAFFPPHLRFVS
jgi:hypothetical protein